MISSKKKMCKGGLVKIIERGDSQLNVHGSTSAIN